MSGAPQVAVIVGSIGDKEAMDGCLTTLDRLGIAHEFRVLSAHRDPEGLAAYVREAEPRGIRVFVGAAGIAAHLAGALASKSLLPVIGVPLVASPLLGLDALLSTLQMPRGLPVATVGVGKEGPANAAFLAAEILALLDPSIRDRIAAERAALLARGRGEGRA
jgi:phosphoribosylaminoimidazole carboxylase PurE protein